MNNRQARRRAARGAHRADVEAFYRLEERRLSQVSALRISDAAAMRALRQVSPAARRLALGMVMHVMNTSGQTDCVLEDAVRSLGGRSLSWRTVEELHEHGILRFEHGVTVLHRVFSSTGQQWARVAEGSAVGKALHDNSKIGDNVIAIEGALA